MVSDWWKNGQNRQKNYFEKKFLKLGHLWGKWAVTHFVRKFTHVFMHFCVLSRRQKKSLGKTVFKMWSHKCTRITSFVPRIRQRL